jgi:hypothetical protein
MRICVLLFASAAIRLCAQPAVPYRITYRTYSGGVNSPRTYLTSETVRAVRSDGSAYESQTTYKLDGTVRTRWRQFELAGGTTVRAIDRLRLESVVHNARAGAARARNRWDPAKSCAVEFDGGHMSQGTSITSETRLGYRTYKIVEQSGPRHRITLWRAPALGCAELGSLAETLDERTGKYRVASEEKAVEVRPGEPNAALFVLPRDFKTVSPDELSAEEMAACCYVN